MKSRPIIMEHFSTVHTSFVVDFTFTNNITILMGDSGTGKTATFSFIRECMAINPKILCLDNYDYQKDIKEIVRQRGNWLSLIMQMFYWMIIQVMVIYDCSRNLQRSNYYGIRMEY